MLKMVLGSSLHAFFRSIFVLCSLLIPLEYQRESDVGGVGQKNSNSVINKLQNLCGLGWVRVKPRDEYFYGSGGAGWPSYWVRHH